MRLTHSLLAAGAALALSLPATAGAEVQVTGSGQATLFPSPHGLAAGDVDRAEDFYVRSDGTTRLVTDGAADAPLALVATSDDGSLSLLLDELGRLVASRPAGMTTITSENVEVVHVNSKGTRFFLETTAQLDSEDADAKIDAYEYDFGDAEFTLISRDTPTSDAFFSSAAADNSMWFFVTREKIDAADTDAALDIYATVNGTVHKISPGNGNHDAHMRAYSAKGGRVIFSSTEKLSNGDVDASTDIYATEGGAVTLLTPSTNAANLAAAAQFVKARRADAGRILFHTSEALVKEDQDQVGDLYRSEDGKIMLLTPGTTSYKLHDVSDDAETALITTPSQALASDTDEVTDMYRTGDGGLVHLLKTNQPFPHTHGTLSPDGAVAAFATAEAASDADMDQKEDVYAEVAGTVTLASEHGAGGVADGSQGAFPAGVLATGEVVISTAERLLGQDHHDGVDAYGFLGGKLSLISADAHAPETTMATTEAGGVFTSALDMTEQGAFECRTDGGAWSPCEAAWATGPLAPGQHVLEARSTDVAGNADATPAQQTVTVAPAVIVTAEKPPVVVDPPRDLTAPALSAAKVKLRRRVPTLTYALSEAAAVQVTIQRRAGRRWKRVRSVKLAGLAGANRAKLAKLGRGKFRVVLVATDAAGNASTKLVLRPTGR